MKVNTDRQTEEAKQDLASGYEDVRCDLCGGDNTKELLMARDRYNNLPGTFSVVQCKNCGFVYTNPRPYGAELSKYYPDDAGYFIPSVTNEKMKRHNEFKIKVWNNT